MFIRAYVSVHALAAQVIQREIALLMLNQRQLHRFGRQGGKMTARAVPTGAAEAAGSSELKKTPLRHITGLLELFKHASSHRK